VAATRAEAHRSFRALGPPLLDDAAAFQDSRAFCSTRPAAPP
jgi:hypothetical protein